MFDTLYSQVGAAVWVVVVTFAFLKGDEPERVGGGVYALGALASLLVQDDTRLYGAQWGLMGLDVILLAAYAGVAWKSRRSWPVWASACQSLIVMIHVMTVIDVRPPLLAFYVVINLAAYGILLALALGVLQSWRDRRADGLS
ncbi:MAG: hypothetical protein KKG14_08960 [Alphaproteobacteria bacterium]|nr:hypothetical protein [Alphaproteobacteria bacterium]MBU1795839.1 hypothetical protein [Alphaproteobacteria bacterium]MBU2270222.1 hypothetical protein [Alphaproteobacteria bacterium]MBU2418816.1 hypothetical protein [Alphaproteobacteria bacterium]